MLTKMETHKVNDYDADLKMFKISKSNCEAESRSLVYKILRTNRMPSTEMSVSSQSDDSHSDHLDDILCNSPALSPSGFAHEDSRLLTFDSGVSPADIIPENYSNVVEVPFSLAVKSEPDTVSVKPEPDTMSVKPEPDTVSLKPVKSQELRRSSRLQVLVSKSNTHDDLKEERNRSDISDSKGLKRKRRRTASKKRPSTKASNATGRLRSRTLGARNLSKSDPVKKEFQKSSTCPSATSKTKIKTSSVKSKKPSGCVEPRQMKLKSMLVVPSSGGPRTSASFSGKPEVVFPKFANVNPSQVLSTLHQHQNTREFLSSRKPIALFFTKKMPDVKSTSQQNGNCQYFKRMQTDVSYLRKKYQMLDPITLDSCYVMSRYCLRNTEIMLLDLISGKEVVTSSLLDSPSSPLGPVNADSGFNVDLVSSDVPIVSCKESPSQNFDRPLYNSDELVREKVVQAMEVLYSEEAVAT